jgi:hypothetical protein
MCHVFPEQSCSSLDLRLSHSLSLNGDMYYGWEIPSIILNVVYVFEPRGKPEMKI